MAKPDDPGDDGATEYGDYLRLDQILGAQNPLSDAHDEMLFIIQHQTSELWMRLLVHELAAARDALSADQFVPAFKMLARVARIFEQLNTAWDVLRTMTPSEYTVFREGLGQSSGLQSWQYRMVEFMLGNRNAAMLRAGERSREDLARLRGELAKPSLYDTVLAVLARSGIDVPEQVLRRDVTQPYKADDRVRAAWRQVYGNPDAHWQLYEMAEKLMDIEDYFRRWRFNHVTTVERIIGFKRGTGGTSGVSYLRRMLEVELFPELWHVRTDL